jgi:catechol 2,3-dioxygenase-like lactoylglutathione lyase family enzyme
MIKKLDSILFYVTDTERTVAFYQNLGFELMEKEPGRGVVKLGDFWLHFHNKGDEKKPEFRAEAMTEPKGAGLYIYIDVKDIDGFYQSLVKKGIKPSSEPRDWPWGNREFVLRDPDGYKLTFYEQLKK